MPRGSRSGGFRSSKAAPKPTTQQRSSSTSTPARKATPPPPAKQATPPPPPAQATPAPAAGGQGQGFFAGMAQIAGGVALGHAITGAVGGLLGGDSSSDSHDNQQSSSSSSYSEEEDLCFDKRRFFTDCIQKYPSDISACQFAMDALRDCESTRLMQ